MKYFIIIGIFLIGYSIYLDTYWKCNFCKKRAHRKKWNRNYSRGIFIDYYICPHCKRDGHTEHPLTDSL
jgi:ssDNA-binding Zn-finger/Zn-ribbon topoisomerase 1